MWSRRIGDNIADVALEGEACCAPGESKDVCEIRGVPECAEWFEMYVALVFEREAREF